MTLTTTVAPVTHTAESQPASLTALMDRLQPVTLDELDSRAALQTRVDRKYLVPQQVAQDLLSEFDDRLQILEIGGQRAFDYRSVYFDTPELLSFYQHLQGRRRRFKIRTRTYLQSRLCRLEVKGKSPWGETVKKNKRYEADAAARLTPDARGFVGDRLGDDGVAGRLQPTLDSWYRRATLLDAVSGGRVTCDTHLEFQRGEHVAGGMDKTVLVETKSERGTGPVDRWLWQHHVRPESMSKYCLGVAILYPGVRANPWHRILRQHFDWEPAAIAS